MLVRVSIALLLCTSLRPVVAQADAPVLCDGTPFAYSVRITGGEDESSDHLRELAEVRLKKAVLGRCGATATSVEQSEFARMVLDRITVSFLGMITYYEVKSWQRVEQPAVSIETSQTYELRAKIGVHSLPGEPDREFHVTADVDQPHYWVGESAQVTFALSQPAYVYVFNVSGGVTAQIFPNQYCTRNQFAPGKRTYPRDVPCEKPQELTMGDDPQRREGRWQESFVVVATRRPLDWTQLGMKEAVTVKGARIAPVVRGNSADENAFAGFLLQSGLRRDEVAEASVVYDLERRRKAQ